jgi:hypothetical protein
MRGTLAVRSPDDFMRYDPGVYLLALVAASCASTSAPELLVNPGDKCRVYLQKRDDPAPMVELVNKALAGADPSAEKRASQGATKVMADAEMALLIQHFSEYRFFSWAVPGDVPSGSKTGLTVEINGNRWTLSTIGSRAANPNDVISDYQECRNAFNDAFNSTMGFQQVKLQGMTGPEFFWKENERLQKEAAESVEKAKRTGGGR